MKKFILILLLFVSFSAIGQTNRFPSIDSLKTYILKYVRNSTVESFTNLRLQNVVYGTAELLDSLTANMSGGVDSIWKSAGGGSDTLKYSKGGTTYTIGVLSNGAYVPYTGATADVDLGNFGLNAKGISVTGTAGNGHLHLKHQSSAPSSTGSSTTVYADANGNLAYKNDGLNRVTFNGLNITADRTFSFQNKSYTLADSADVAGKQGALTITTTGSSGAATLVGNTLNIPQYSGGGGGSADSSWVSSETGIAPNQLGYLVNSTLGSLPSGWADNTPNATVTFSSKMIVSGGTTGTSSLSANTGSSTVYSNRIDMDFYPYSKMRYAFTVVPQDKTGTTNGIALHFQANSLNFNSALRILFNLSGGADSGKISMATDFGSVFASSTSLAFNASDTLNIEVIRDGWYAIASMRNRRTGNYVDLKYNAYGSAFGTGGKAYLGLLGGSQHITSAKIESYEPKDGTAITIIGDSQFAGSGATSEEKIAAYQIFRGNKGKVANLSNGSLTLSAAVLSHVPAAIALNNPIIISLGYNDRRDLATDTATLKTRMAAVVDPIIAAGKTILGVTTLVPTNTTPGTVINNNFDAAIINYCAANNLRVIRIDSILKKSGDASYRIKENYLGADAIHWSDSGQYVAAQKVIDIIGETIPSLFKDSVSAVTMYNLPTGEVNMNRLVVDNTGKVKQVPATTFDGIYNARNYNGAAGVTTAQSAEIHISNPIKTDSAVFIHSRSGALFGFNGGSVFSAGSTLPNVIFSSRGVSGTGYPQAWPNITGSRNVIYEMLSTKGGSAYTLSGNDNFIINSALAGTVSYSNVIALGVGGNISLTSGSNNIHLGADAGRGMTTGQRTFIVTTKNTSGGSFPTGLTDAIILGEATTAGDNPWENNDVSFATGGPFATTNFWFGGRTVGGLEIGMNFPAVTAVSNYQGCDAHFKAGRGRGTGRSGYFKFSTWNSTTSGSTLHSSLNTELTINNKLIQVGTARFQTAAGANVASANDLTLGNDGNVFTITGTTQINAITTTNWQAGSEIILIFSGSVTVKNNTAGGANTAVLLLAGGVDFSATSNDVLKLVYNGTSWFEVSRSVN